MSIRQLAAAPSPGGEPGAIVYVAPSAGADVKSLPVGLQGVARRLNLDAWAIVVSPQGNRRPPDGTVVDFTVQQVRKLAEEKGYRRIYLAGASWGGWIALAAAAVTDRVDGLLVVAPGYTTLEREELLRQRDQLASLLAATKARRVFVAYFNGDAREAVPEGRGPATREALERAGVPYWVLDRPPEIVGHAALSEGRFGRRYAECLETFFRAGDRPAGSFDCSPTGGYARGGDIDYPTIAPADVSETTFVSDAVAPLLGQWRGDSDMGAYVILTSAAVWRGSVQFVLGFSPIPESGDTPWIRELWFKVADDGTAVFSQRSGLTYRLRLVAPDRALLDMQADGSSYAMRFLLRRTDARR